MGELYWIHWWTLCIILQLVVYGGQARKILKQDPSDQLNMDQAYLTISNKNWPNSILFTYNLIVCEHCDFDLLGYALSTNTNKTLKIDTRFPYDFNILSHINNSLLCQVHSYSFYEHASYLFEVSQTNENVISCTIAQTAPSSHYVLPIVIAIIIICLIVLIIQAVRYFCNSQYLVRILARANYRRQVNEEVPTASDVHSSANSSRDNAPAVINVDSPMLSAEPTLVPNISSQIKKPVSKRLQALDTFRGFSLMVMIFVNYGGGGYWFFDHSIWNGLTLADLVFPWFTWMMGVSIVLSQRSLLKKRVRKRSILWKICRRTIILFFLGLVLQGGDDRKLKDVRILGVLQRLALCYGITAILVLFLDRREHEPPASHSDSTITRSVIEELSVTILQFWREWFAIGIITLSWILITFVPKLNNCPRGYVGPGGKHEHGKYTNCTGGVAGFLDRTILGSSHLYDYPTCRDIYQTQVPYDPEGLLGILTGTLLCYLGVHASHVFVYSASVRRTCVQWIVSSLVCGFWGLLLSKGGHSESWIPINKNLWSLTFIFILASLAYLILTILYLLVDVYHLFTGEPWLWLGMNSIVLYVGHDICGSRFPVHFAVEETHKNLMALHVYGVMFWTCIAGILYFNKIFVAI